MGPAAILSVLVQAKGVRDVQRDLGKVDKAGRNAAQGMSKFQKVAGAGILAVGAAAAAAGPKLIDLASDAEETASKFKIVFGKETQTAIKQLDKFSKATGTSRFTLREQAAQLQALIKPMGVTSKAAGEMSVGLTKLATDLASFNNSSVEEAITALQSGLVGEAEPLRRFGVQLSANRVEAFAYAQGIAKQGAELTAAQAAQARYAIILQDTKLAQGDAVRTSDSFANQLKRLKSQVTDTATELGVKLLPAATRVVSMITKFIDQMRSGQGAGGVFIGLLERLSQTIRGTARNVADLVGWFRKHKTTTDILISVMTGLTAAFVAYKVATVAATVATRLFAAAALLLNLALRANPIGIVVTGLIALGAALVTAYKRSETFRKIVNGTWTALKNGAVSAFNTIKGVADDVLDVFKEIADVVSDVVDFIGDIKIPKIDIPFIGGSPRPGFEQQAATGGTGGTYAIANQVASKFGLGVSSGYRSPSHNAAVGGVPNSLHTHGSPGNPGAIDLVGPVGAMYAASAWAAKHLRLAENLVHDVGSGLHLHLGFFKRGGKVPGTGSGDRVPAMLEPGEFVIQKKIVDMFGPTFFASMNGMKKGGRVGKKTGATMQAIAAAAQSSRRLPAIEKAAALAALTPDLADDIAAADELIRYWEGQLGIAQASGKGVTAAAQGLKSARDSRASISDPLKDAIEENNRLLAEQNALNQQIATNQLKVLALAGQGDQIVAAVVAAVNGGIGGRVGLGFHGIRSTPGSVANL